VLEAYGWTRAELSPITVGLINETFRVSEGGAPVAVLQRLHPIFAAEVNDDIDAIATELFRRGMVTPRLVRTTGGATSVEHGGVWRALTFVNGRTLTEVASPAIAHAAGALAGRFHAALDGFVHRFHFTRAGVHDTARHLSALEQVLTEHAAHPEIALVRPIADAILAHAQALSPLPTAGIRIVHGDLKITNLLFHPDRDEGLAIVDLDTLAHGTLAVELGDALRSWCNPSGESREGGIDVVLFAAALAGFRAGGGPLSLEEREAIPLGVETIATELASRFCRDALEDRYFGWDPSRFPDRRAHCRARAASQLALARSVRAKRSELERAARSA
jgi:Ser/Thr protein kinase RdoA (MazF antagonist)